MAMSEIKLGLLIMVPNLVYKFQIFAQWKLQLLNDNLRNLYFSALFRHIPEQTKMTQSEIKLGLPFMAPNPIIERKPEKFYILWQIRVHNSRTEKM